MTIAIPILAGLLVAATATALYLYSALLDSRAENAVLRAALRRALPRDHYAELMAQSERETVEALWALPEVGGR